MQNNTLANKKQRIKKSADKSPEKRYYRRNVFKHLHTFPQPTPYFQHQFQMHVLRPEDHFKKEITDFYQSPREKMNITIKSP